MRIRKNKNIVISPKSIKNHSGDHRLLNRNILKKPAYPSALSSEIGFSSQNLKRLLKQQ